MELVYKVCKENLSINQILKKEFDISNRLFTKLLHENCVTCNGKLCDTRNIVNIGDTIIIDFNYEEDNSNIVPTKINLNIRYEDDWLIVLDKPKSQATHPSILHYDDTLSNGLKYYFDSINLHKKIRPVNRLDYNTSGLIVFAKNEYIQDCLIKQMANNTFKKTYIALVHGLLEEKNGQINMPIARKSGSIIERCVSENGKKAITNYEVLEEKCNLSLVKCTLITGRTHQIRVHFAAIGHPLVGDTLYGKKDDKIDGQMLHCSEIEFIHPITKTRLSINSVTKRTGTDVTVT